MRLTIASTTTGWTPFTPTPMPGALAQMVEGAERLAREACRNRPVPPPFNELPSEVGLEVSRRWREPCEAAFEFLVDHSPSALATLIKADVLSPGDLSFAAEILGRSEDSDLVRRTLGPLLTHGEAVVREGAIYGLTRHVDQSIADQLKGVAVTDPSAAVRSAAKDALDE